MSRAVLALENGRVFRGRSFGQRGTAAGEVVFHTGMSGYQEVVTDPSYRGQLVVMTHPHIGNTGVNDEDAESDRVWLSGYAVREPSPVTSSWRATGSLEELLRAHRVVGIAGLDTRAVVREIRAHGALGAVVSSDDAAEAELVERARATGTLAGRALVDEVTTGERLTWRDAGESWLGPAAAPRFDVVAYDFGIKRNILRLLAHGGARVTVVPAGTAAADVLALAPDGVFLSNGPGDPEPLDGIVREIRALLGRVPMFGICLGHQILGRALQARTFKLKFGHHGANHPVRDIATGRVEVTSQNHGFTVDPDSLPAAVEATHVNLNDDTLEGFRHREMPLLAVQHHPEACPGPHDSGYLFDRFFALMTEAGAEAERA